jgi:hypothetical protein
MGFGDFRTGFLFEVRRVIMSKRAPNNKSDKRADRGGNSCFH